MNPPHCPPLLAVVGPTGSGKSELAIRIAEQFDGEIVNCDSLQIYKYFDLGTAKVPLAERRGIPHHLLDSVEPDEIFSAGEYGRRARAVLRDIASQGRVPVVCGGTGFYLRALLDGLPPLPGRDAAVRGRLAHREKLRPGSLYRLLRRLDPAAAMRMHAQDAPKVLRALEVRLLSGRLTTEQPVADPLTGFRTTKIGLFPPRQALYQKLDLRVEWMFAQGLVAEVEGLLDRGVPESAKPFESLGYRQALQVLRNELTVPDAIASTQQATRQYAKRQVTWFRHEPGIRAIESFGEQVDARQWLELK